MLDSAMWIGVATTTVTILFAFALCLPFLVLHKVEAAAGDLNENGVLGASVGSAYLASLGLQCALLGAATLAGHTLSGVSDLEFRFALGLMLGGMIISVTALATWSMFLAARAPEELRSRVLAGTLGINAVVSGLGFGVCVILCSIAAVTTSVSKRLIVMALCYLLVTVVAAVLAARRPRTTGAEAQPDT